jgi:hypothetical protein
MTESAEEWAQPISVSGKGDLFDVLNQDARLPHQCPQLPALLDGFARIKDRALARFCCRAGHPIRAYRHAFGNALFRLPPEICRACSTEFSLRSAGSTASDRYYAGDRRSSFRLRRAGAGARSGSLIIVMGVCWASLRAGNEFAVFSTGVLGGAWWPAPGFTDTEIRCHDGTGGVSWIAGDIRGSSRLKR